MQGKFIPKNLKLSEPKPAPMVGKDQYDYPSPPLSLPTPGKTVPHHPLGDGYQVMVPHPPLGDCTTTVHAHLQAHKLQHNPWAYHSYEFRNNHIHSTYL